MKKIQTVILLCLLLASLYACESRQLNQQDPQPVVGESVESVQPEEPEETQPSIPENAPASVSYTHLTLPTICSV